MDILNPKKLIKQAGEEADLSTTLINSLAIRRKQAECKQGMIELVHDQLEQAKNIMQTWASSENPRDRKAFMDCWSNLAEFVVPRLARTEMDVTSEGERITGFQYIIPEHTEQSAENNISITQNITEGQITSIDKPKNNSQTTDGKVDSGTWGGGVRK
jgi:hypothetical protein